MGSAPNAHSTKRNAKTIIPTTKLFFIPFPPPSLDFFHPEVFSKSPGQKQCNLIPQTMKKIKH
jgi:hypothetical protein